MKLNMNVVVYDLTYNLMDRLREKGMSPSDIGESAVTMRYVILAWAEEFHKAHEHDYDEDENDFWYLQDIDCYSWRKMEETFPSLKWR